MFLLLLYIIIGKSLLISTPYIGFITVNSSSRKDYQNVKELGQKAEGWVKIPPELLGKIDELVEKLDFRSREGFVEAAVRRLIDHYVILTKA